MRKFWSLSMILLILFTISLSAMAQDDTIETCSVDDIQAQVDEAIAGYELTRISDSEIDDALISLEVLQASLEDIYHECDAERLAEFAEDAQIILDLLREGGYVIYVRHTSTDRSQSDTDLSSCETQRNLDDQGRDDAGFIGRVFPLLEIPVGNLISTQYCRTLETTQLAFGEPNEVILRTDLEANINSILATVPEEGTNTIIVAHTGSLFNFTDVQSVFEEGDALIFEPMGGEEYTLVGRIQLIYWRVFASLVRPN